MKAQLEQRLETLKREFELGKSQLNELEMQEAKLRETMLRISGAIQVLEELLAQATPPENGSHLETVRPDAANQP